MGNCLCTDGCAGPDGKCHQQQYKTVLTSVRFQNVEFSSYYLHAGQGWFGTAELQVSEDRINPASQFVLKELPNKTYALFSALYPDYAVNGHWVSTGDSASYEARLVKLNAYTSPQDVALRFSQAPGGRGVTMNPHNERTYSLYASSYSHGVSALSYDPGEAGYWISDPSLPFDVKPFDVDPPMFPPWAIVILTILLILCCGTCATMLF